MDITTGVFRRGNVKSWDISPDNLGFPYEVRSLLSVMTLKVVWDSKQSFDIDIMEIQRELENGKQKWFQTVLKAQ